LYKTFELYVFFGNYMYLHKSNMTHYALTAWRLSRGSLCIYHI